MTTISTADRSDLEVRIEALQQRIVALEAESARMFDDAQREADTMFAQYQLSQLLASGAPLGPLAESVLLELLRHGNAVRAALWLVPPGEDGLELLAAVGEPAGPGPNGDDDLPDTLPDAATAFGWCTANGWSAALLEETREVDDDRIEHLPVGLVAVRPAPGRAIDPDHLRFLALVRHELAISFRAAQLREALARERAELTAIVEGATDAIVAVDGDRRVVRLNPAASRLLGEGRDRVFCETLLGCRTDAPEPLLRCGARCPFAEVLGGGLPIASREHTIVDADGREVPVAASYARTPGRIPGAVAIVRDLRASKEVDELKSSFVATVSHELRTPLAIISGYVDTILHLRLDETEARGYVSRIGDTVARLNVLVGQILEIVHLDTDPLVLEPVPVPTTAILERLDRTAAERPDTPPLDIHAPADLPPVLADPSAVGQILDNLIANAAKYGTTAADGRPARITIRTRTSGGQVVFVVADHGPGIDPADRERIFDRFYRGRGARGSAQPGSGLGLYLCRRLVEAHGGRIWLERPRRGAAIAFSLPVAPDDVFGDTSGSEGAGT